EFTFFLFSGQEFTWPHGGWRAEGAENEGTLPLRGISQFRPEQFRWAERIAFAFGYYRQRRCDAAQACPEELPALARRVRHAQCQPRADLCRQGEMPAFALTELLSHQEPGSQGRPHSAADRRH